MKLNIHFLIMLIIACVVYFADILIYILNLNYWLAIAISFAIAFCVLFVLKKKIKVTTDFEKLDFIFFAIILIKFIVRCLRPDSEWDTCNYHIYLQENPFIDKINFDFFAGRTINTFQFPLGDRIYYLFRKILGYRLGTLPSYYALIVAYYQVKRIIRNVTNSKSHLVPILANMACLVYIVFLLVATYYIDIFSMVFVLEIVYLVFTSDNFIKDKFILYSSFLISGIATGIKVPNIIPIFVLYIFMLIKNIKNLKDIKWRDIPICILLYLLPFGIYAFDNIVQTGSFIFPYYNNIFKSEYFGDFSWHDTNFGIPNIFYSLIWPFMIIINPLNGYDFECYDFIWPIGYAIILVYIVYSIIKHKNIKEDKVFQLAIVAFVLTIVWAIFLMGYTRYAYFLSALYVIVFSKIVLSIDDLKISKIKKALLYAIVIIMSIIMIWQTLVNIQSLLKHVYGVKFLYQKYGIFQDRSYEKIHIDGAWLVVANDSRIATLVREEGTPIYNLETKELYCQKNLDKQKELREKELYILVDDLLHVKKINALTENNFEIVEVYKENLEFNFILGKVNIYKVEYNEDFEEVQKSNSKYLE